MSWRFLVLASGMPGRSELALASIFIRSLWGRAGAVIIFIGFNITFFPRTKPTATNDQSKAMLPHRGRSNKIIATKEK